MDPNGHDSILRSDEKKYLLNRNSSNILSKKKTSNTSLTIDDADASSKEAFDSVFIEVKA